MNRYVKLDPEDRVNLFIMAATAVAIIYLLQEKRQIERNNLIQEKNQ